MGNIIKKIRGTNKEKLAIGNVFSKLKDTLETNEQLEALESAINILNTRLDFYNILIDAIDTSAIVAITDPQGRIIYANEMFIELSKYSLDELLGRTHSLIRSEYHDDDFFKEMWKTISMGQVWSGEVKNKAKDGSYYWVKSTIIPVLDEQKEIQCYVSIRTDITEGKILKEQMLIALEDDYKKTIQAIDSSVFRIYKDSEGVFRYKIFEGKLTERFGYSTKNVKDLPVKDFLNEFDYPYFMEKYEQAYSGQTVTYKFERNKSHLLTTLTPHFRNGEVYEIIGVTKDITAIIEAREKIYHMAYHDDLTDLPNQRKLDEELRNLIFESNLTNENLSLFYIDLDRFKVINDTLGYFTGDEVLKMIASRLKVALDEEMEIYRVGGDDFVIIFKGHICENYVKDKCTLILNSFETPFYIDMHEIFVSASIGVSTFPEAGNSSNDLIKNSNIALQLAKSRGRNQYQIFNEQMYKDYHESLQIEGKLKKAILDCKLELHYQPKVSVRNNEIVGFEALVRWKDDGQYISPVKFIPIAEESGLITKLGEWVLLNSCLQVKTWLENGFDPKCVSVNVSAIELQHPEFVSKVAGILHETRLEPRYLEIEITENSLITETLQTINTLKGLRELGVSIAIDDFGTGYSSFSYLQKFPVTSLKIDQTFIRSIFEDESQEAIVRAMIYVGHSFKMSIVAEGVEDKETFNFLKLLKCDHIQGYYISKPQPAAEIVKNFFSKSYSNH